MRILLFYLTILFLTSCVSKGYDSQILTTEPLEISPPAHDFIENSNPRFSWPLKTKVIVPFGSVEGWVPLKGMVLRGRDGEAVRVAQAGYVRLIDENLTNYGKTVIIEHSDQFSTVYARNSKILVRVGQEVRQGEAIATAGGWGKELSPDLYFEIRKDSKAVNPADYLIR